MDWKSSRPDWSSEASRTRTSMNSEEPPTYAPVSRLSVIRASLAIINKYDLDAVQLDVKTAFLSGILEDDI